MSMHKPDDDRIPGEALAVIAIFCALSGSAGFMLAYLLW